MERTWRWFGKNDKITLAMLRQIGVQGIVTALHDVPNGEVWTREKIHDLKAYIESYGMRWSVVESLPVSESIKYAGKDRDELIEKYKVSLRNLSAEGIHTICYNFMPVLDWARTDLSHPNPNGTTNLYFSHAQFAYFDICILQRANAKNDYSQEVLDEVEKLKQTMTPEDNHNLVENIIVKTQGFVSGNISEGDEHPVELFRELLDLYKGITKEQLRENMRYFLEAIMPVCNECDMYMCVHPDDPPFPILGLPRIVTNKEDIQWFLDAVDDPHNGLTFCAGAFLLLHTFPSCQRPLLSALPVPQGYAVPPASVRGLPAPFQKAAVSFHRSSSALPGSAKAAHIPAQLLPLLPSADVLPSAGNQAPFLQVSSAFPVLLQAVP